MKNNIFIFTESCWGIKDRLIYIMFICHFNPKELVL